MKRLESEDCADMAIVDIRLIVVVRAAADEVHGPSVAVIALRTRPVVAGLESSTAGSGDDTVQVAGFVSIVCRCSQVGADSRAVLLRSQTLHYQIPLTH